ncbi:hypothetical protein [Streptomyces vinaceus]|uniref:hypothetical protein n=1 Tax=Streptomyces vinaceus TaxID=1960 RepID=UPI0037F3F5FC
MTLTVETATHQARRTWRHLGVEEDTAEEMAEELSADLLAAASDGRSVADYIGGDIETLATSWAVERGLLSPHRRLKETAAAAVKGAALPALASTIVWWVGWSHLLDCSSESFVTTLQGSVSEVRKCPNAGIPVMWVGWLLCMPAAFFMIRRAVASRLQRLLAPAREATVQALTKALPLIILAAALISGAIGFLASHLFGYFAIVGGPIALAGMLATAAAGTALVRHRTCPPVNAIS